MADEKPSEIEVAPCSGQKSKSLGVDAEFAHTRKRLARQKIAPLVQFCVFAYECDDKSHDKPGVIHVGFSTMGSSVQLEGGLQASIEATEQLLKALKAKLQ